MADPLGYALLAMETAETPRRGESLESWMAREMAMGALRADRRLAGVAMAADDGAATARMWIVRVGDWMLALRYVAEEA